MNDDNKPEIDPAEVFTNILQQFQVLSANARESTQETISERNKSSILLKKFFIEQANFDSWLLFEQAIPILKGISQKEFHDTGAAYSPWYKEIKILAIAACNHGLNITGADKKEKEWRVNPKEFVRWAIKKNIIVHSELITSLGVTLPKPQTELKPLNEIKNFDQAERHAFIRERFYIAALSLIANHPEQCQDKKGAWAIDRISKTIELNSSIWFGSEHLPLAPKKVNEIISKAIRSIEGEKIIFPQRR